MRRLFSLHAEIARRRNERFAEVPRPHSIRNHPRSKRGRVAEDPVGKFPPTGTLMKFWVAFSQHRQKTTRCSGTWLGDAPARQHVHIAWLAGTNFEHREVWVRAIDPKARVVNCLEE